MNSRTQPLCYPTYAHAKKQLATIEPIDYFFAKEVSTLFSVKQNIDTELLFHLLVALSESLRAGHTCLPMHSVGGVNIGYASDELGVVLHNGYIFPPDSELISFLSNLNIGADAEHPIVFCNNKLYMRRYFSFERDLKNAINAKSDSTMITDSYPESTIAECIHAFFPTSSNNNSEIDWQKIAVANALNKNFSVIAGGPGTGKTYTVTKLLAALVYLHKKESVNVELTTTPLKLKMALVAPTGKAAQRLSESITKALAGFRGEIADEILNEIPTDTLTIHRLLGVIPNSPNFRFNVQNVLNIDVLLIDEVSMVDLAMMTRVFRALPHHCKVILLGDADQLPSVSAGSVLSDIAPRPFIGYSDANLAYLRNTTGESLKNERLSVDKKWQRKNRMPVDYATFLTKSRRFDSEGGIGLLAKSVISGEYDTSWSILNQSNGENQVSHLQHDTMPWLKSLVERYYFPIFSCDGVDEAFSLFSSFRVLCATRVGEQGVDRFNELITQILIERNIVKGSDDFYQGRPIMITENNYIQGLYNGDIGFIWRHESGHLMAVFEDAKHEYKWIMTSKLPSFETVFAMTIHKTQGSEFGHVAMVLPNQKDNKLLSRELLYTGITRAKKHISIATNASVWRQGVETNIQRHSGYADD